MASSIDLRAEPRSRAIFSTMSTLSRLRILAGASSTRLFSITWSRRLRFIFPEMTSPIGGGKSASATLTLIGTTKIVGADSDRSRSATLLAVTAFLPSHVAGMRGYGCTSPHPVLLAEGEGITTELRMPTNSLTRVHAGRYDGCGFGLFRRSANPSVSCPTSKKDFKKLREDLSPCQSNLMIC